MFFWKTGRETATEPAARHPPPLIVVKPAELKVLARIGKGSFGEVFKARWQDVHIVAVKVLHVSGKSKAEREHLLKQFQKEVRLLSTLHHPNIVRFLGVSDVSVLPPYFICEYLNRGTLTNWIRKAEPHLQQDLAFARDAARALAFLHAQKPPIIHRDVKSDNFLLADRDNGLVLKLSDFGLSRVMASLGEKMTPCGTIAYSAPEVIRCEAYSEKADVYGFGIVLWQLMTHQIEPYPGCTPLQIQLKVSLQRARPQIPHRFVDLRIPRLMHLCWREQPDARPSMAGIAQLLERLCADLVDPNGHHRRQLHGVRFPHGGSRPPVEERHHM